MSGPRPASRETSAAVRATRAKRSRKQVSKSSAAASDALMASSTSFPTSEAAAACTRLRIRRHSGDEGCKSPGLGVDRLAVGEAIEPSRRDRVAAVAGAQQGARHGRVRVGLAPEPDDGAEPFFEAEPLADDLQRDPGREAREAAVGPVDRPPPPRLVHPGPRPLATPPP